ncbi:putative ATPase [Stackebrandtia albiflava]|uniref:Putative ATPase n=1 Tax=Stackebrandtia albiflava TaxID=406432 RepID=A0A562V2C3_9ACTN|nr:BTAD domain-containing putative transcriptional regulator [Stackebrandtia albiflava]TWJ11995.1 putative ATPase [Stackebrandtia albiflava]
MRFGVLGPLAVWTSAGEPVRVPEAKVRMLLATLLTDAGRPVSTDRLVADLWGDNPPAKPLPALRAKVSQLRRALDTAEPGARDLVVSHPTGYLLDVPADDVDTGRFARLREAARRAADPADRAALLGEALALWRGEPFPELDDASSARPVVTRLTEQRLATVEDRAEARLELGEYTAVSGELAEAVAAHPRRERLRAAHIRALYGSGRQAEALEGYRLLRDTLTAELGVDPGPELADLHRRVLRQDPALAAAPAQARPGNLPAAPDDLIGRDDALTELAGRLDTARLLTLTGPGGVGKTRLATRLAADVRDRFPDGVWLVELAGIDDPSIVPDVAAAVLGVRDDGDRRLPIVARMAASLRDRRVLVVLDNCEHLVEAAAALAAGLLSAAPGLRLVATSREPLRVPGEQVWPVPALTVTDSTDPVELRHTGAVALFVARAAAASPGFALRAGNAEAVAAICRRLDGMPLALELAATRVRGLGVHELATRLDDRFALLSAGNRGGPARQRTLRAVIDWSWQLLEPDERRVLRRLTVFPDGCTLDAAEAVCGGDDLPPGRVADLLARLVDRSLVSVGGTDRLRYRLLESVAAYATERLDDPAEAAALRRRARDHYLRLTERAETALCGTGQVAYLAMLDTETLNVRAVLDVAVAEGDAETALRLAAGLSWYKFLRGRYREADRSLAAALECAERHGGTGTVHHARARAWRTGMAVLAGDGTDSRARVEAALRGLDGFHPAERARFQWFLEYVHTTLGDFSTPVDHIDGALSVLEHHGDHWGAAAMRTVRANHLLLRSELAAAAADAEAALSAFTALDDRWGQLRATAVASALAEIRGDYAEAARSRRSALESAEELHIWPEVADRLSGLGRIALLTGDLDAAEDYHRRSLALATTHSHPQCGVFAESGLAMLERRRGRLDAAEERWIRIKGWCGKANDGPGVALALAELGFIAELRGDAVAAERLHREGLAVAEGLGDRRAVALAREGLAGARVLAGDPHGAARLLGAAAAAREASGAPLPEGERGDVDRITAAIMSTLDATAFRAAFEEGARSECPVPA